jgi:hypothetical protein
MKPSFLITTALFLVATSVPSVSAAEAITFDPSSGPEAYASNLESSSLISITEEDGVGLLTFRSFGGGELLLMQKDGNPLAPNGRVELELRCSGEITLGVFLRGAFVGDNAYMAFFSASPDGTIRLSLTKTLLEQNQRPGENAFAQKHTRGFDANQWLTLRFELDDLPNGGVALRASVIDRVSGQVILEADGEDTVDPLPAGGTLGLRYFAGRSPEEYRIDVRSITLPK